MKKIVLITGASSGFGKIISEHLANQGYHVFATARRKELLEKMRSNNITPFTMDVTSQSDIDKTVKHIISEVGHIDILINNAGFGFASPIELASMEDIRYQYEVNLFGLINLTKTVIPYMRERHSGHIINIASVVGQLSKPIMGFYASSKHAVEGFSDALRMELYQFGIKVTIVEPGMIKTDFDKVTLAHANNLSTDNEYFNMIKKTKEFYTTNYAKAPKSDIILKTIDKILTSKKPKDRYTVGRDAKTLILLKRLFGYKYIDPRIRKLTGCDKIQPKK